MIFYISHEIKAFELHCFHFKRSDYFFSNSVFHSSTLHLGFPKRCDFSFLFQDCISSYREILNLNQSHHRQINSELDLEKLNSVLACSINIFQEFYFLMFLKTFDWNQEQTKTWKISIRWVLLSFLFHSFYWKLVIGILVSLILQDKQMPRKSEMVHSSKCRCRLR